MFSVEHSILQYKINDDDLNSYNPYLKNLKKILDDNSNMNIEDKRSLLMTHRSEFVSEYSFTIPYYEILKKIASYSPIVEIGAGSGYWARCLSEAGADVIAYDSHPPGEQSPWEWYNGNPWFDDSWYGIIKDDESAAAQHPDRTLFLAWPMPSSPMAYNALVSYKNAGGKTIIFIGDPHPASSGDEFFYQMLYEHNKIDEANLYSWPGINEKLIIYSLE